MTQQPKDDGLIAEDIFQRYRQNKTLSQDDILWLISAVKTKHELLRRYKFRINAVVRQLERTMHDMIQNPESKSHVDAIKQIVEAIAKWISLRSIL